MPTLQMMWSVTEFLFLLSVLSGHCTLLYVVFSDLLSVWNWMLKNILWSYYIHCGKPMKQSIILIKINGVSDGNSNGNHYFGEQGFTIVITRDGCHCGRSGLKCGTPEELWGGPGLELQGALQRLEGAQNWDCGVVALQDWILGSWEMWVQFHVPP